MDTRTQIVFLLVAAAIPLFAFPLVRSAWFKVFPKTTASPESTGSSFGSDDLPPPRAIAFNVEILKACGRSLTPEQKLKMLVTEGVTKARALEFARTTLEDNLSPVTEKAP
jgi:hypothetical protein